MDPVLVIGLSFGGGALISLGGWLKNWLNNTDQKDFDIKKFLVTAGVTAVIGGFFSVPAEAWAPFISPEMLAVITSFIVAAFGKPAGLAYSKVVTPSSTQ